MITGLDDQQQFGWNTIHRVTLEAKATPAVFSRAVKWAAVLSAAAGLGLGDPVSRMQLHIEDSTGQYSVLLTMRGRSWLTNRELRIINRLLHWLTQDPQHRVALNAPDQLIRRLHQVPS